MGPSNRVARIITASVAGVGGLVLLLWALGLGHLSALLPGAAPMRANTAVGFVLLGAAVWLATGSSRAARIVADLALALVGLLAGATLLEHGWGGDLGIDQVVVRDGPVAAATAAPGRMSSLTATSFLLLTAGWWLILKRRWVALAQLLAVAAAGVAGGALLRTAYGFGEASGPVPFTHMPTPTSLLLLLLAGGLLLAGRDAGWVAIASSPALGGAMARRLLPWVVGVPVVLGWLRLAGQRAGLYDVELGLTLHVAASTGVLLAVVLWSAAALTRIDVDHSAALAALVAAEERFRATFEQAAVGIAHVAPDGRWLRVNRRLCEIVGYSRDELLASSFQAITHPEDPQADLDLVSQMLSGAIDTCKVEKRYLRKGGQAVWIELTVSLVREATGEPSYFIAVVEDISARRAAEIVIGESERRYREIFEAVPVSLWEEDWTDVVASVRRLRADGVRDFAAYQRDHPEWTAEALRQVRVLDVNERTLQMFAAASKQDLLSSLGVVFSTDDTLPRFVGELTALGEGRRVYETEMALRTVPGELIHVLLTMRFPALEEGSGRVLVSLMEITDRKRAEQALAASESRLRRAVVEAPIPMLIHDEEGRILHMSRGWTECSGYTEADLPTIADWTELAYGERRESVRDYIDQLFALGGTMANGEWTIRAKDGGSRWWDFYSTPLGCGIDGKRLLLSLAVDVTERKAAQTELARYAAELERSNQDLQEFAFVASHDLQEPLRKIVAFGDRLKSRAAAALDESSRDYLERMEKAAERMGALIESLLELSRVSTRGEALRAVPLSTVLAEVLVDLELRVRETGAVVEVGALPTVWGDRAQLHQLFSNLLVNALKFRRPDAAPHIGVEASRDREGRWQIAVRDDGIGFEEKYLDRIFKPFQRLHSRRDYEGSGMGLAICRKIVARHGGELTARSAPGAGATFLVTLLERPDGPRVEEG